MVNSRETKKANIGILVHNKPQLIIDFLTDDVRFGTFRRETIHMFDGAEGGR